MTLERPPSRIVSLIPSNTEILFALGLGDAVVGVTDYCDYPPEVKEKPTVGDLLTTSIERVVALKPDLTLATGDNPDEVIQGLRRLGLTVFVVQPQTVGGILDALTTVGRLTGKEASAAALVKTYQNRLNEVYKVVSNIPDNRRMTVFVGDPANASHWTPGPGTFTTDIIVRAGGKNIADDLRPGSWGVYSLEQIVARNPDFLLVTASLKDTSGDVRTRVVKTAESMAGWREIDAVRDRRIAVVVSELIFRPGPRAIDGVEQLARQFYPEAFE